MDIRAPRQEWLASQIILVIERPEKSLDTQYQDDKILKPEEVPADALAEWDDGSLAGSAC